MDAHKLRIGNLFQEQNTKEVIMVTELSQFKIGFSGSFKGEWQAKPIPLTEEWLLKLGFEKTKENFCTYDLSKISIYMPSIYYEEGRTYFNSWVIIEKSPETVHQLQNLFFCLCGKELELSNQNVM